MIIIGNRAHYSAIGGVENSVRGLIKVASDKNIHTTIVCREALIGESLDPNGFRILYEERCGKSEESIGDSD